MKFPLDPLEDAMEKVETTTAQRRPTKVVVRKLERLETTAVVLDPGCRNDACS